GRLHQHLGHGCVRPFAYHRSSRAYLDRIRACRAVLCRGPMDLIGGKFADPRHADGVIDDVSPADLSHELGRSPCALEQVDGAVAAARDGARTMARMSREDRASLVRRIGAVLEAREEDLARAIALDVGKPLW